MNCDLESDVRSDSIRDRFSKHAVLKHSFLALAVMTALVGCDKTTTVTQTPSGTVTTTTISPSADASAAIGKIDASLAAAASGVRSSAAASEALAGVGEAVEDTAITAEVKAALLSDPDVKSVHIDVDTKAGVITLSGTVPNSMSRSRADRIARDTHGVRSVDNQLIVRTPA
jgi:osmotically-inducible protein OsmY